MMSPSRMADQFVVRMPKGMRERLRIEAIRNERSMNSEIVFHLRNGLGMAAGSEFGDLTPAAEINSGKETRDE